MQEQKKFDAESVVKIFKFYMQFKNPYLQFKLPLKRIQAKSFYAKYHNEFEKLVLLFNKYNLDLIKYIRFFIEVLDKYEKDIKTDLVSNVSITKYIEWLKIIEKQDKIYNYFVKSAKNIANECIQLGFMSTKEYIRYLIFNKKIAEKYVTGQISLYFFAAIPNFKNIIQKLDPFAKAEFQKIYNRFEMYNAEITSAFMKKTNYKVNPIKYVDNLIFKIKNSKSV